MTKILLVEDDLLIGLDMKEACTDAGCDVIGPVSSAAEALELIASESPNLASLDFNIDGGTSVPVARALAVAGVPFVFVTGRPDQIPTDLCGLATGIFLKPVLPAHVLQTLIPVRTPSPLRVDFEQ